MVIDIKNIKHMLKIARLEFNNNYAELTGKNDENFLDICYIMSKLRSIERRLEKNENKS